MGGRSENRFAYTEHAGDTTQSVGRRSAGGAASYERVARSSEAGPVVGSNEDRRARSFCYILE